MQCLILAGGLGTRMKSIGGGAPKALLKAGDHTFINWQLQWLKFLCVNHVILALGHVSKIIEEHIEGHKKSLKFPEINYSYDGPKLLGTGGAIKKATDQLEKEFMVIYGDSFLFIDPQAFRNSYIDGGLPLTLSIFKNHDLGDRSNVIYKNGELLKYDKTKKTEEMEYIDYGLSYINRDYFLKNTPKTPFDFSLFLSATVEKKMATAFVAKEMFQEIGSPEGYSRFLRLLEKNNFSLEKLRLLVK
jgi:MurNAc alpha-1-phosphate uridylyltransferase